VQLILGGGARAGVRLLGEDSVGEMTRDQLPGIPVVEQAAALPELARPFPRGAGRDGFGLGFQVRVGREPHRRAPGSLSWGGIANTHFWIDPEREVGVVLLCQLLPFHDERVLELLEAFETTLHEGLDP
jgi:CubicO group peptidase (beta-lactamase class C family)